MIILKEDKCLIEKYIKGESQAIEELVKRYINSLYHLSYSLTHEKNSAEELFQETWIKVIENIETYNHRNNFKPWLYTICINTYRDKYRKEKRWLGRVKDYFTNQEKEYVINNYTLSIPMEDIVEKKEQEKTIKNYIKILEDKYRLPIILFYFQEMTYQEIAELLKLPMGTVKSRLNTAKKKLRKMMEVNDDEGKRTRKGTW